jgi:hypothetical protein
MRKSLTVLLILVVLLSVGGVLILGYFGIIPMPGDLFNVTKPKDLGVTYTEEDFNDFMEKSESQILPFEEAPSELQTAPGVVFTSPKAYDMSFTNSEISARINYSKWSSMPVENVQVKFSDGGIIEVSGNLVSGKLKNFASIAGYGGYSEENVDKGLNWIEKLGANPSFYLKAKTEITNNELNLDTQSIEINRLGLPADQANKALTIATETILKNVTGLDTEKLTITENAYNFKGNAPSLIYSK